MSHNLEIIGRKASMAYTLGTAPWHGLGQALSPDADLGTWRQEAGLTYDVKRAPVLFRPGPVESNDASLYGVDEYAERNVLYRSDTHAPLSVVSSGYNIVQPGDILDFVSRCVSAGGFTMETAGIINDGRKVWALARVNDGAPVIGHDIVRPYLLAATSYDGTMATTFKFTAIQVVCDNTLTMRAGTADRGTNAQKEKDKTDGAVVQIVRVPHSVAPDFDSIRTQLGVVLTAWDRFLVEARLMADAKINDTFTVEFLRALLRKEATRAAEQEAEASRAFAALMAVMKGDIPSRNCPDAKGTAWQLMSAVTWYADHVRGSDATRLNSTWFGSGESLKNKARDLLLEVVSES